MPAFSLMRVLAAFALLLMPLAGQGHAMAAVPHHQTAASPDEDCHGAPEPEERSQDGVAQCLMACAALPALEMPLRHSPEPLRLTLFALPLTAIGGLAPEAEIPPPRA
jgi:hypothetical protein